MAKRLLAVLTAIVLCCCQTACKGKNTWNYDSDDNSEFSTSVSAEAEDSFRELREQAAAAGVSDDDNKIVVEDCIFYSTGLYYGFYAKYYGHVMANESPYCEIFYFDGSSRKLLDSSSDIHFNKAACNGEKLSTFSQAES